MQQASMSSRIAAMKLDYLFIGIIWEVFSLIVDKFLPGIISNGMMLLLSLIISIIYFAYPTKKTGQSLGKRILGIKVVSVDDETAPLAFWQVLMREVVGKTIGTLVLFLGYAWAYTNPERKAWHDKMSKTKVVSLVFEEEKTFLQKVQQVALTIVVPPALVALVFFVVLYSSMPLESIKEQVEAAGIQVGNITGSLAGGIHISELSRHDKEQNFSIENVDVKFDLWSLLFERTLLFEKVTAERGSVEVPADFSWISLGSNILAFTQVPKNPQAGSLFVERFQLGSFSLKNILLENNKKAVSSLQEISVTSLNVDSQGLHASDAQFQIKGFKIKLKGIESNSEKMQISNATGSITPELVPMLKGPMDFHFSLASDRDGKIANVEAGMMMDKIKVLKDKTQLTTKIDKLALNDFIKTSVPIEELSMNSTVDFGNLLEMLAKQSSVYSVKICGKEFQSGMHGPFLDREDRHFTFKMTPKPVESLTTLLTSKEATLDDLFDYEVSGTKTAEPPFASDQDMLGSLCFERSVATLQPREMEVLKPLEKFVHVAEPITAQAALVQSVGKSTSGTTDLAQVSAVMTEAKGLLRQGKAAEAVALMEKVPPLPETIPPADVATFYNLKAWIYLYANKAQLAVENFNRSFNLRKDISDAEGLMRSYEALKNPAEVQKWLAYIKFALKDHPELKSRLTPNMQRKIASEDFQESNQ